METYNIMIDYVKLETEVKEKASTYLDEISEENLRAFAEATKYIAQSVLENYFFSVDELYTAEGPYKIINEELYNEFSDFHNGYRSKMKDWANEHEIQIQEQEISSIMESPEFAQKDDLKIPLLIAGVGTLVAVGLFIFTTTWIALAAELLALSAAAYVYKRQKDIRQQELNFRIKQYEMKIASEKSRLINGIIEDLKKWLQMAEDYSNELLVNFNIK